MHCPVTVTILTKNEEALIERCISSVQWADEVLVLDSGSVDRTRELAWAAGAAVHEQSWLGWVPQRQRAIELARNDWILVLEADEIVSQELASAIVAAIAHEPSRSDAFAVDRRDELFGKLLPNMKRRSLRTTFVRLLNRRESHYNPAEIIHETVLTPGRIRMLPGILLHWRNVSFVEQMRKDVDIAILEADLMTSKDKRTNLVQIFVHPLLRFLWCYVRQGGYRLGAVGFIYALMRAHSEFLRHAVLWERQNVVLCEHPPEALWKRSGGPSKPTLRTKEEHKHGGPARGPTA